MRDMVIRAARVVLPTGVQPAEVAIRGDRITAVRPYDPAHQPPTSSLESPASILMSGVVDTHVHVNAPGRSEWEGFETASAAAAAGGVTTIVDMPLNSIPATTTTAALEEKRRAARAARVAVEFWGGIVPGNAAEIDALADAGVRGFKCFLSPSGVDEFQHVGEQDLRTALPLLARRGLPLLVHAESPAALLAPASTANRRLHATWLASRPAAAEVEAIAMLIRLCREFRAHIHIVHLAASAALDPIRAARREGLRLTVETCPHYLAFDAEAIGEGQTFFKCAPPIRDAANREALWDALREGTIDLIATDHSPCPPAMKGDGDFLTAWGGIASLELGLGVVWTEAAARGFEIARVADWMCAAPARLAGFADRGAIAPGMRADLVHWDPHREFTVDERRLHQRHKRSPYAGRALRGRVLETWSGGELVYVEGQA